MRMVNRSEPDKFGSNLRRQSDLEEIREKTRKTCMVLWSETLFKAFVFCYIAMSIP